MKKLVFTNFEIIDNVNTVELTASINSNSGYDDNEIRAIIEDFISTLSKKQTLIGRLNICYSQENNVVVASLNKR